VQPFLGVNFLTGLGNSMKLPSMHISLRRLVLCCCIFLSSSLLLLRGQDLRVEKLTGSRGGNLVLALPSDPTNFNRMLASGLSEIAITERLSADLVHIDRSTLRLEPSLATHWETDKTGRVYTVYLRKGVRFSDNTPFTADDVLFTLQVLTDPKTQSTMAGQIETGGEFPAVSKIDDHTVKLSFKHPIGMGLRMLDSVPILPKSRLLKAYQEGRLEAAWGPTVNPSDVVGLGPFRLKEYQQKVRIVLERNPYYWKKDQNGQRLPYLDTLTFLLVSDLNSEALRFQQGELDLISSPSLNPGNYASLRRTQTNYTLQDLGPGLTVDFLWFNLNSGKTRAGKPFVDPEKLAVFRKPEFRRAISYALDRSGMVRSILLGLGTPQYGIVSSGNKDWYYSGITRTEYNPERSKELLAQIGLRDENRDGILEFGTKKRPLEISLLLSTGNSVREKTAQVIRDNLSKIGIGVSTQLLLPNELASRAMASFDYEAILLAFAPTDVAPDLQTDLWYSSGPNHFWNPSQKKPAFAWESTVDDLISRLVTTADATVRKASFDKAQSIWSSEMPVIPTIASDILAGWSKKLGNLRPSILAPHLLWNAEEITKRAK
jgi:peptide/nickel transport system substrate-binding protein